MAERRDDGTWLISGRVLAMPVEIRRADAAIAIYPCAATAAEALIADERLRVLRIGGRALAAVVCMKYVDGDLDAYDEVGIGVLVRPRGAGLRSLGLYTLELPVTAAFTREAGIAVWALPKWIADTALDFGPRATTVSVAENAELAITGRLRRGRLRVPFPLRASATGWSLRADGVLATRSTTRLRNVRVSFGGTTVTTGPHRMGKTVDALQLAQRPLVTVTASMTATIAEGDLVGAGG